MTRKAVAGVLLALVLSACGSEASDTAPSTSTVPSSSAVPTTTTSAPPSAASTVEEPPAETTAPAIAPPAEPEQVTPEPEAAMAPPVVPDVAGQSDMPHGEALFVETCQRFLVAIDALESTGAATRAQSVDGMSGQLQSNPSWSTLTPDDQEQILRGVQAAGAGSC